MEFNFNDFIPRSMFTEIDEELAPDTFEIIASSTHIDEAFTALDTLRKENLMLLKDSKGDYYIRLNGLYMNDYWYKANSNQEVEASLAAVQVIDKTINALENVQATGVALKAMLEGPYGFSIEGKAVEVYLDDKPVIRALKVNGKYFVKYDVRNRPRIKLSDYLSDAAVIMPDDNTDEIIADIQDLMPGCEIEIEEYKLCKSYKV